MAYTKPQSPCARCGEAYEEEGANVLFIRCGALGKLIETQRLKCPRGAIHMCTEGPLEGCPRGFTMGEEKSDTAKPTAYEKARAMLERSLRHAAADCS